MSNINLCRYSTYEEMFKRRQLIDRKVGDHVITHPDIREYHDILSIEEEMQKIRDNQDDEKWIELIEKLLTKYYKKTYKCIISERPYYKSILRRHIIVPEGFDESILTAEDLLDMGEHAIKYIDNNIVLYCDNSHFIGMPQEVEDKINEKVFMKYLSNLQKRKNTKTYSRRIY